METIETGLGVIDLESIEVVDEFQRFVRPQINPILTDFCKRFTSIKQADADSAATYKEPVRELGAFITRYPNAAWESWGDYDTRQLEHEAGFATCPYPLAGLPHFNTRKWHKDLYDIQPKGLRQTVESMGLVWLGTYHRGIDDARNVASIIKEMLG